MGELKQPHSDVLWRAARVAMVSGAGLAVFAFAAAAVAAPVGVVRSLDSMVLAVHGAGLLCALGLFLGALAHPRRIGRWFAHPAVLCLGGLVAWSVLSAPFVRLPWASLLGGWFGGEGALLYLDVAAIVVAVAVLSRRTDGARLVAALGLLASVALPLAFRFAVAAPEIIPEYTAPYALMAPVFAYRLIPAGSRPRWGAAAILASAPALLVSTNVTAWVAVLGIGLPLAVLCRWAMMGRGAPDVARIRRVAALAVPAILVLATAGVLLVGWLGLWNSITSRFYLFKVIAAVVSDTPSIGIAGQGWGATADAIAAHLTASGAVMWDGSWDATLRGFTHSHHLALELLLATGVPGLLLGVGAYASLASTARRALLPVAAGFVVASAAYQSMWFFTIGNWAAFAVALGLILGRPPRRRRSSAAVLVRAMPGVAVAAQGAALMWLVQTGLETRRAVAVDFARDEGSISCVTLASDRVHQGAVIAHATRVVARDIFAEVKSGAVPDAMRARHFALLLCGLDEVASRSKLAQPLLSATYVRANLALDRELAPLRAAIPGALDEWAALSRRLIQVAPARSDEVIAYLEWEFRLGNWKTVLAASQWILSRRAEDPVGLWYAGMAVLASGDPLARVEGLSLARRALARGIERFLPIPAEAKASLGAS